MQSKRLIIIHGPNLNLLGTREKTVYGDETLKGINQTIANYCRDRNLEVQFYQSNSEGKIIDKIHEIRDKVEGIIINPGAYTHYSYAIRDALAAVELPAVEVHLSDIKNREPFRAKSVIAPVCIDQIYGWGPESYLKGIESIIKYFSEVK